MNVLNLVVKTTRIIVGGGVGMIIGNAVKATTPADLKTYQKVAVTVGSFALGSMVAAHTEAYIEGEIRGFVSALKEGLSEAESAVIIVDPTTVQDDATTTEDPNA